MQQINLLNDEVFPAKEWLTPDQLLTGAGIFAVLLLLVSGVLSLQLVPLGMAKAQATDRLLEIRTQQQSIMRRLPGPEIRQQLDTLRRRQRDNQELLVMVGRGDAEAFSVYLQALARARVEGLWLQNIELRREGVEVNLNLSGQATEPVLVARLLQALADEETFSGHRFANLDISQEDSLATFTVVAAGKSPS